MALCDSSFRTPATLIPSNVGNTYGQLLSRTCEKILNLAKPFSEPGGNTAYKNLVGLKEGQIVGQWRDSDEGLGGGRYPYDVNTGLMPAALRAIAELVRAGAFENVDGWDDLADKRAEVWETWALEFFTVKLRSKPSPKVPIRQQLTADRTEFRKKRQNGGSKGTNRAGRSLVRLERIRSTKMCACRQSR